MKTIIIVFLLSTLSFNVFAQTIMTKKEVISKNKKELHNGVEGLWEVSLTSYFTDTLTNKLIETIVLPEKLYNYFVNTNDYIKMYNYNPDKKSFKLSTSQIAILKDNKYFIHKKINQSCSNPQAVDSLIILNNLNEKLPVNFKNEDEFSYEYFYFTGGENEKVTAVFKYKRIKRF